MTRIVPLTVVAGAVACLLAVGSAQAAPVSSVAVGKLADASKAASVTEQVHYRRHYHHHHRWWKKRYYKRHRHYGHRYGYWHKHRWAKRHRHHWH